jgi:hypothetical protein
VPFATAAAALLREARPGLPAAEVRTALRALARDVGEDGPDPIYGAGLVQPERSCLGPS